MAGLQTNVCVEATVRAGLAHNVEVAVPDDAVSTDGPDLHYAALNSMRVLYTEIGPLAGTSRPRRCLGPGLHHPRLRPQPRLLDRNHTRRTLSSLAPVAQPDGSAGANVRTTRRSTPSRGFAMVRPAS
ncbi:isochorismatase family protein [Amycolatopsis arida]|uniref:cysteine hydrolase family protein n=1 Tax=Amycolatopsis arida TaxID=587909 RepID=UPI001AB02913